MQGMIIAPLVAIVASAASVFKNQRALALENLALRQQVALLKRSVKRPQVTWADRAFWIAFVRYVDHWRSMLHVFHPDTRLDCSRST